MVLIVFVFDGKGMDMDRYPAELRVLAVDDDPCGLLLLKKQLNLCNYNNGECLLFHPFG